MKKIQFYWEYVLNGLVIAASLTDIITLPQFIISFLLIFAVIYLQNGYMTTTLYYIPVGIILVSSIALDSTQFKLIVCGIVVMMQYSQPNGFELPKLKQLVGFHKKILQNNLQYYELYPLDQSKAIMRQNINWNQGNTVKKIIQLKGAKGLLHFYHSLTFSYLNKIKIQFGVGIELERKGRGMAFCHGKEATPFWYSTLLLHFANSGTKVGAIEHSYQEKTDLPNKSSIKEFRQKEIQRLGQEFYLAICQVNCSEMILVGHTYGCSSLLNAYHRYKSQLGKKITHIILLEPCFFPLKQENLTAKIDCPVLMLANENFLLFQDNYDRNIQFVSSNKVEYVIWRQGSSVCQTDLCYLINNGQGNQQQRQLRFQMNFEAINRFMKNEKVEGSFGAFDLGRSYKPKQFLPEQMFVF